jgi:transglutaminase/protease-like cytokinesis protein 3
MAYRYLLDQLGIKSEEIVSEKMEHCWNYVRIGGNWYHVDVTWDDPVYQGRKPSDGPISHEHFLLSDSAIQAKKHHSWNLRGLPEADDKKFDRVDWDGAS